MDRAGGRARPRRRGRGGDARASCETPAVGSSAVAGGSLSGIAGGMDAIWRPSAEEAHAQWEAQLELPAPAPIPGDKGDLDDGPVVIEVPR